MNAHYPDPPREDDAESLVQQGIGALRTMLSMIGDVDFNDHDIARLLVGNEQAIRRVIHERDIRDVALCHYRDLLADLLAYAKDAPPELQARVAKVLAGIEGGGP